MWKISHGKPQNLANWPAEFGKICHGKLWSLNINVTICHEVLDPTGASVSPGICSVECEHDPSVPSMRITANTLILNEGTEGS